MLSAVENLGSGRVYTHPFPGTTAPSLLGQLPLSATGLPLLGPNLVDMSVAEFVRPHPKQQRYSESSRNGSLQSPSASRLKYPEQQQAPQNGPVNLAVSHSLSSSHNSQSLSTAKLNQLNQEFHERTLQAQAYQQRQQQHRHQEQQKEATAEIGQLYSPTNPRLAFFPSTLDANSYGLNYGLYPFGYPATHLDTRMMGRPTYLPGQREPYNPSSFLAPGAFSSSETAKNKIYPSLSHLNSQTGLKSTSLPQLPQEKMLSDERSPTMPLSPPSSSLVTGAVTYATERGRSNYLNELAGGPEHSPMHTKYQSNHTVAAPHEKENKHEHKQHHSSHSQKPPQQLHHHSASGTMVSAGSPLSSLAHHHFPPPQSPNSLTSSPSSTFPLPGQRHHSMPHPAVSNTLHQHHHSLPSDGFRLDQLPQENEFKVPSGKEGSLKHRILTRPASEKDIRRRSPTSKSTIFRPFENGLASNFTKGALIQLADECKRVEDVRTEDLVQTAEKSSELRLAESTTVRITPRSSNVIITFSYDNNKSRIDIEAAIEHPFFVYGQGWASCNPEKSMQQFGLKCQRLQVGDICLSLIPRDKTSKSSHSSSVYATSLPNETTSGPRQYLIPAPQNLNHHDINGNQTSLQHHQRTLHLQQHPFHLVEHSVRTISKGVDRGDSQQQKYLPQNLSRKFLSHHQPLQTIPTTATATAVSSRPSGAPTYGSSSSVPVFSMPFSATNLGKLEDRNQLPGITHFSPRVSPDHNPVSLSTRTINPHGSSDIDFNDQPVPMVVDKPSHSSSPSPSSSSLPPMQKPRDHSGANAVNNTHTDDENCVIDASVSRKRRWSAPEACDDENDKEQLAT